MSVWVVAAADGEDVIVVGVYANEHLAESAMAEYAENSDSRVFVYEAEVEGG